MNQNNSNALSSLIQTQEYTLFFEENTLLVRFKKEQLSTCLTAFYERKWQIPIELKPQYLRIFVTNRVSLPLNLNEFIQLIRDTAQIVIELHTRFPKLKAKMHPDFIIRVNQKVKYLYLPICSCSTEKEFFQEFILFIRSIAKGVKQQTIVQQILKCSNIEDVYHQSVFFMTLFLNQCSDSQQKEQKSIRNFINPSKTRMKINKCNQKYNILKINKQINKDTIKLLNDSNRLCFNKYNKKQNSKLKKSLHSVSNRSTNNLFYKKQSRSLHKINSTVRYFSTYNLANGNKIITKKSPLKVQNSGKRFSSVEKKYTIKNQPSQMVLNIKPFLDYNKNKIINYGIAKNKICQNSTYYSQQISPRMECVNKQKNSKKTIHLDIQQWGKKQTCPLKKRNNFDKTQLKKISHINKKVEKEYIQSVKQTTPYQHNIFQAKQGQQQIQTITLNHYRQSAQLQNILAKDIQNKIQNSNQQVNVNPKLNNANDNLLKSQQKTSRKQQKRKITYDMIQPIEFKQNFLRLQPPTRNLPQRNIRIQKQKQHIQKSFSKMQLQQSQLDYIGLAVVNTPNYLSSPKYHNILWQLPMYLLYRIFYRLRCTLPQNKALATQNQQIERCLNKLRRTVCKKAQNKNNLQEITKCLQDQNNISLITNVVLNYLNSLASDSQMLQHKIQIIDACLLCQGTNIQIDKREKAQKNKKYAEKYFNERVQMFFV